MSDNQFALRAVVHTTSVGSTGFSAHTSNAYIRVRERESREQRVNELQNVMVILMAYVAASKWDHGHSQSNTFSASIWGFLICSIRMYCLTRASNYGQTRFIFLFLPTQPSACTSALKTISPVAFFLHIISVCALHLAEWRSWYNHPNETWDHSIDGIQLNAFPAIQFDRRAVDVHFDDGVGVGKLAEAICNEMKTDDILIQSKHIETSA